MTNKLTVRNVYKIFGPNPDKAIKLDKEGAEREEIYKATQSIIAVNDVSFDVPRGQIFVVMGLSGSGKSTLIRCLNRLYEPTSGDIILDDLNITAADKTQLRQLRLGRMAMVFQHFALFPHMMVWENAAYGLKARGMPVEQRREEAVAALEAVGLGAWADSYPASLSGGMQQRVGLARAMAVDPEVLLMDEPFSALDPLIRRDMQDELLEIQDRIGTTIIFITHDLQEALKLGDQIAIMKDGRFVQVGTAEQIVPEPATDYVLEFTRDVDRSRVLTFGSIRERATSLPADAPASDVSARFGEDENLRGIFLTDAQNKPIGLVEPAMLEGDIGAKPARALMDRHFSRVNRSTFLSEGFDRLGQNRLIAVIDRHGQLIGAVDPVNVFAHLEAPAEDSLNDGEEEGSQKHGPSPGGSNGQAKGDVSKSSQSRDGASMQEIA